MDSPHAFTTYVITTNKIRKWGPHCSNFIIFNELRKRQTSHVVALFFYIFSNKQSTSKTKLMRRRKTSLVINLQKVWLNLIVDRNFSLRLNSTIGACSAPVCMLFSFVANHSSDTNTMRRQRWKLHGNKINNKNVTITYAFARGIARPCMQNKTRSNRAALSTVWPSCNIGVCFRL